MPSRIQDTRRSAKQTKQKLSHIPLTGQTPTMMMMKPPPSLKPENEMDSSLDSLGVHFIPVRQRSQMEMKLGSITDRLNKALDSFEKLYDVETDDGSNGLLKDVDQEIDAMQSSALKMKMKTFVGQYRDISQNLGKVKEDRSDILNSLADWITSHHDEQDLMNESYDKREEELLESSMRHTMVDLKTGLQKLKNLNESIVHSDRSGKKSDHLISEKQKLEEVVMKQFKQAQAEKKRNINKAVEAEAWKNAAGEICSLMTKIRKEGKADVGMMMNELETISNTLTQQSRVVGQMQKELDESKLMCDKVLDENTKLTNDNLLYHEEVDHYREKLVQFRKRLKECSKGNADIEKLLEELAEHSAESTDHGAKWYDPEMLLNRVKDSREKTKSIEKDYGNVKFELAKLKESIKDEKNMSLHLKEDNSELKTELVELRRRLGSLREGVEEVMDDSADRVSPPLVDMDQKMEPDRKNSKEMMDESKMSETLSRKGSYMISSGSIQRIETEKEKYKLEMESIRKELGNALKLLQDYKSDKGKGSSVINQPDTEKKPVPTSPVVVKIEMISEDTEYDSSPIQYQEDGSGGSRKEAENIDTDIHSDPDDVMSGKQMNILQPAQVNAITEHVLVGHMDVAVQTDYQPNTQLTTGKTYLPTDAEIHDDYPGPVSNELSSETGYNIMDDRYYNVETVEATTTPDNYSNERSIGNMNDPVDSFIGNTNDVRKNIDNMISTVKNLILQGMTSLNDQVQSSDGDLKKAGSDAIILLQTLGSLFGQEKQENIDHLSDYPDPSIYRDEKNDADFVDSFRSKRGITSALERSSGKDASHGFSNFPNNLFPDLSLKRSSSDTTLVGGGGPKGVSRHRNIEVSTDKMLSGLEHLLQSHSFYIPHNEMYSSTDYTPGTKASFHHQGGAQNAGPLNRETFSPPKTYLPKKGGIRLSFGPPTKSTDATNKEAMRSETVKPRFKPSPLSHKKLMDKQKVIVATTAPQNTRELDLRRQSESQPKTVKDLSARILQFSDGQRHQYISFLDGMKSNGIQQHNSNPSQLPPLKDFRR